MAMINIEGFLNYYHSATRGRNQQHYESIEECMEQIEKNIRTNHRSPYMDTHNYICNHLSDYRKTLKTMLMSCGMSKASVDTLIKHFNDWFKNM